MRNLTAPEVRELLSRTEAILDPELSEPILGRNAYRLPDNQLLFVDRRKRGILFASRDEYLAWGPAITEYNRNPRHLLYYLLPEQKHFIERVPQLCAELGEKLGLDPAALDASLDSLRQVDRKARRHTDCFTPALYPHLVAYTGEVMRQLTGGQWQSFLAEDGETLEPWIIGPDGRRYNPFIVVYREFDESRGSLAGATAGEIGVRLPRSKKPHL